MVYNSPSVAYLATLKKLLAIRQRHGDGHRIVASELVDYSFIVRFPDDSPIITMSESRNEKISEYLVKEKLLYLAGELSAEVWANRASKFWQKLANPDGTINSNYGWLVFQNKSLPNGLTPWQWAEQSLRLNPETRQAYIRFAQQRHLWHGNRDQVCTMHMNFLFRSGSLHGTVVMRSNDVVKGLAYDMPWFCYLLKKMANSLGWPVGTYTHIAHSMHLYCNDVKLAREMSEGEDK